METQSPVLIPHRARRRWTLLVIAFIGIAGIALGLHFSGVFKRAGDIHEADEQPQLSDEERAHYQQKLADAVAELDRTDPGWRLEDIEKARTKVPDEENGALIVLAVAKELPRSWPPLPVLNALDKLVPNRKLTNAERTMIEAELKGVPRAVEHALRLPDRIIGRFPLEPATDPLDVYFSGGRFFDTRKVSCLLQLEILVHTEKGDLARSLRWWRGMVNTGRAVGDEPLIFSQMVRNANVAIACANLERLVAQGELADEDLAAAQQLLEKEANDPIYPAMIRGEWAFKHEALLQIIDDPVKLGQTLDDPLFGEKKQGKFSARDEVLIYHASMFPFRMRDIEIAKLPVHKREQAQRQLDADMDVHFQDCAVPHRASGKIAEQPDRLRHMRLRCIIGGLAAERYRQKQGKWPESAADLKGLVHNDLLGDPADNQPLRIKRTEDGLVVYSIGMNGKDDGGNIGSLREQGEDIGVRLWDVKHRGLPPLRE